jgi:hypothetical protein
MLKARAKFSDGSVGYVLGLTERNLELLAEDKPIYVHGRDLALRGTDVLIACAESKAELDSLYALYALYSPGPHMLHVIGIARSAMPRLRRDPIVITDAANIDGKIILVYGENEQKLAEHFGMMVEPAQSGYRDVLDPLTGRMHREKVVVS